MVRPMRTRALFLGLLATAGCNVPLFSRDEAPAEESEVPPPVVTPALDPAATYDALRLDLDAKRSRLASDVDQVATAPGSMYFTQYPGTVYRASSGAVFPTSVVTEGEIAASDAIVVARKGWGWTARSSDTYQELGAVDADANAKSARFRTPYVDGASIYLHGFVDEGDRAVYAWQPGAEPTLHARLPGTGLTRTGENTSTLDGNLESIGVSAGTVYVLLSGIVYSQRTDGTSLRVTPFGTILSAAFYPDGALVGSHSELAFIRADTAEVTKLHEVLRNANAPQSLAGDFVHVKEYAGGGERIGPHVVYVGATSGKPSTSGVFAFDERTGGIVPIALAPLDGERFTAVHVTSDRGVYITSLVEGRRVLSYVDGANVLSF